MANKPRQKYGLFFKLSLEVIEECEVGKNPHIFLNRANQQIQKINRHFYGTLNYYYPMAFAANQEQNSSYIFKDMLLQPEKSDFILAVIKKVESHKSRSHWTFINNSEVNNNHKGKDSKLKTVLSIWYFKRNRFLDEILMKHKSRLCSHVGMQQWGFNFWVNYHPVVNWISVRLMLSISSIHE